MPNMKDKEASTDTTVCPDLVPAQPYGNHSSFTVAPNRRLWRFDTMLQRDMFLEAVERGEFRRPE